METLSTFLGAIRGNARSPARNRNCYAAFSNIRRAQHEKAKFVDTMKTRLCAPIGAWEKKMALLDRIHEEILPQVMTLQIMWDDVIEPEDFLDRDPLLKVDHDAECVGK